MSGFDDQWVATVLAAGDRVLGTAGIALGSQVLHGSPELALLWEADPTSTDAHFPGLGLPESYGGGWTDAHCIDFWLYVDLTTGHARTSFEGGHGTDPEVVLVGDAARDAAVLARLLTAHLEQSPG